MHGTSKGTAGSLLSACLIGVSISIGIGISVATAGCSHPEAAAGPQKEPTGQSVTGSTTLSNKDRAAFTGAPMPAEARQKMVQWIQSHSANSGSSGSSGGASQAPLPPSLQGVTAPGK